MKRVIKSVDGWWNVTEWEQCCDDYVIGQKNDGTPIYASEQNKQLLMENRVNKTLHLKRKCTENNKYDYQCLSYDFVNWTEGDLAQLNSCLKYFKEHSNGEFDFYIGECGKLDGSLLESDAPDGFYPAVDKARKEERERLERETRPNNGKEDSKT